MKKLVDLFKSLTAVDHFLVFLIILSVMKIVDVFAEGGTEAGLHFMKLGVGLFVISTVLFYAFRYFFDKKKKYKHALISTFLILLVLSHAEPDPVRGLMVIGLVYVAKFFVKYKRKNIFNPIVFGIGVVTLIAMFIPAIATPPADFSGIDFRFGIMGMAVPLALLPITLSLIFNVGRMKKYPLAISFISVSIGLGLLLGIMTANPILYVLTTAFVGVGILTEPKTAPGNQTEQAVYGGIMALVIAGLYYFQMPNAAIMGVFFGNMGYFLWREFGKKKVASMKTA